MNADKLRFIPTRFKPAKYPHVKAIPHNDRLTALRAACLHIFRHLTQILLEIRQYFFVEFMQAYVKSDCAIHTRSLCGIAFNFYRPSPLYGKYDRIPEKRNTVI